VAVVSEDLWRSRFGSNPNLVGQSIPLDMRPFTVVGILPANFRDPDGPPRHDVWISVMQDPLFGPRTSQPGVRLLDVIAQLKPGFSVSYRQPEMGAMGTRFAQEYPEDSGFGIRFSPIGRPWLGT
jgi:hypothetical protein